MTTTTILEINLISAQNLKPPSKNKTKSQIYAVVWIDPSRKLRTGTDSSEADNPTWNDKFLFQVSPDFIDSATSGVNIEIYAVRPFRDSLIGTARCLLSSCLGKLITSVYVHRPSGNFQGILNIAATLCDVKDFGVDLEIFQGSPSVSFHDLTTRAKVKSIEKDKEKDNYKGWGRLRMVRSSPSLSTMVSSPSPSSSSPPPASSTLPKEASTLRPVRSDPSISTMLSPSEGEEDEALKMRRSETTSDSQTLKRGIPGKKMAIGGIAQVGGRKLVVNFKERRTFRGAMSKITRRTLRSAMRIILALFCGDQE